MLPCSVSNMLIRLREKTESGDMAWEFDEMESAVQAELPKFGIQLRYNYSLTEHVPEFRIVFTRKLTGKDYHFWTDERCGDYQVVRRLYDCALASELAADLDLDLD